MLTLSVGLLFAVDTYTSFFTSHINGKKLSVMPLRAVACCYKEGKRRVMFTILTSQTRALQ
ncbi:hypothetical protein FR762_17205 [Enterobacter sp. E76]|nr:hypothetical protein FR762_17205 [Enterobacter sp. E76]